MKSLKEIRLGVGTTPGVSAQVKPRFKISMGGPSDSANSTFSSYLSKTFSDDDDHSEEEMSDHILRKRIKVNGKYSLNDTLENIDESFGGVLQIGADIAKAIPGLDQLVGYPELMIQSAQAKDAFDGLNNIVKGLTLSTGADALYLFSTDTDYQQLLNGFHYASLEDKQALKEGVEKILEVIKNMIITCAMTFDTIAAIPAFLGGPTGVAAEVITNVATTAGTVLRGIPIERFIFKSLAERDGIVSKFIDSIVSLTTMGGAVGTLFSKLVSMLSSKGGEIIEMFFNEPQELLKRLAELYKAASQDDPGLVQQVAQNFYTQQSSGVQQPATTIKDLNAMPLSESKYSILFLLEGFNEGGQASTKKYDDDPALKGKQSELPDGLQKAIIKKSKSKSKKEGESCSECGASIYEGEKHSCSHLKEKEIEEFSSAGAVAGYTLPLGSKNKRAEYLQKEQIKRMRILEMYHQRTTNRLK